MSKKRVLVQFGAEVRRRRKMLGLSLEQLAERAELTSNYIGTIENGHRDPSLSTIKSIAHGLDVPPAALLGPLPELSPKGIEMARLFDEVPKEVQEAVLMILRGVLLALP